MLDMSDSGIAEVLLFGNSSLNDTKNTSFLNTAITKPQYILSAKIIHVPLTNY